MVFVTRVVLDAMGVELGDHLCCHALIDDRGRRATRGGINIASETMLSMSPPATVPRMEHSRGEEEAPVLAENDETPVLTVTSKGHQHCWERIGEDKTASKPNVESEEQDDCGDQELAPGDSHDGGDYADQDACDNAGYELPGGGQGECSNLTVVGQGKHGCNENEEPRRDL